MTDRICAVTNCPNDGKPQVCPLAMAADHHHGLDRT